MNRMERQSHSSLWRRISRRLSNARRERTPRRQIFSIEAESRLSIESAPPPYSFYPTVVFNPHQSVGGLEDVFPFGHVDRRRTREGDGEDEEEEMGLRLELELEPEPEKEREILPDPGLAPPPPLAHETVDTQRRPIDDGRYAIEYDNDTLWPLFDPEEGDLEWKCPSIIVDAGDPVRRDWVLGKSIGNQFGSALFPPPLSQESRHLPPRLFDLATDLVVESTSIKEEYPEYIFVSHVWGETQLKGLPGDDYGVEWDIPIQSSSKLKEILKACRAVGGIRYLWMDILCLDQRRENRREIARMKNYLEGASGCLVWLDNAHYDMNWNQVLHSIREINRVYCMDKSGRLTIPVGEYNRSAVGGDMPGVPQDPVRCFQMLRNLTRMERAPWFKRVWTLQEGIIPESTLFVTPERYILDRSSIFKLAQAFGSVAQDAISRGKGWGVGLLQELQRSEIWKMLKLKQLHAARRVSYHHLFHAMRSRSCQSERDRLLGVLGLVQGLDPITLLKRSPNLDLKSLYRTFYRMAVESGDFSSLFFLGGPLWHTPQSMGLLLSPTNAPAYMPPTVSRDTHDLSFNVSGDDELPRKLMLQNVGYDQVTCVHCLSGQGTLRHWADKSPNLLAVDSLTASEIARACGMPDISAILPDGRLGPGYLAAMLAWKPNLDGVLKHYDESFLSEYRALSARALVMALRCRWMEAHLENSAVVVVGTSASRPQLAVVTEPLHDFDLARGEIVTVMPRSYFIPPGQGCLICVREAYGERNLRKVGIGLGDNMAAGFKSFVLEG